MVKKPEISILEILLSILVTIVVIVLAWLFWYNITHREENEMILE